MSKVTRILAVLDGTDEDAVVVSKAVAIAHQHRAPLELFLCDAQRAYALLHSYDQTEVDIFRRKCIRESRHYLESLRDIAVGADVAITIDAACESPLYEAIVRKAVRSRADLVIKSAVSPSPLMRYALDANDWQLMRACPVTLLLSRGKSWQPCPKFLAAVDVSAAEMSGLPASILDVCAELARGCHGRSDIAYSEPRNTDAVEHRKHFERLQAITSATSIPGAGVHVLSGDADEVLPAFAAGRGYDAIVMGALTHREGLSALVGTLTSKLVELLDCDFVLVKPESYQTQVDLAEAADESLLVESESEELPRRPPATPDFVSPWQLPGR
ncbi:MAG TPA: universal stress protein [Steroidobacteraceae bacterium]